MFRSAVFILSLFYFGSSAEAILLQQSQNELECFISYPSVDKGVTDLATACASREEFSRGYDRLKKSKLLIDMDFCNLCLASDKKAVGPAFLQAKKDAQSYSPATEQEARSHLETFHNIAKLNANGMFFHASILSKNQDEGDLRFLNAYDAARTSANESIDNYWKKANTYFKRTGINIQESEFKQRMTISIEDRKKYLDPPMDSCIDFREYLAFNQLPMENGFYVVLANTTEFKQEEWDYELLKAKLADMTAGKVVSPFDIHHLPESEERRQMLRILGKIKFLHANPLYKNLFAQKAGSDVADHQHDLFKAIKKSFAKIDIAGCMKIERACRDQAWATKAVKDLQDNTADIFKEEHVLEYTIDQAEKNFTAAFDKLTGDDYKLMRYSGAVQGKCEKPTDDLVKCVPAWGGYCHQLEVLKQGSHYAEKNKLALMNLLERDLATAFSPDNNEYFDAFKKENCKGLEQEIANHCKVSRSVSCKEEAIAEFRRNIAFKGGKDSVTLATMLSTTPPSTASQSVKSRIADAIGNFAIDSGFTNHGQPASSARIASITSAQTQSPQVANSRRTYTQQPDFSSVTVPGTSSAFNSGFSSTIPAAPSPSANEAKVVESKNRINEIDIEKEWLRSQLKDANERIAQANENERKIQEERIKYLEQKDAQLSSELANLKKYVADLEKVEAKAKEQVVKEELAQAEAKKQSPSARDQFNLDRNNSIASTSNVATEQAFQRVPASIGGTAGAVSSLGSSSNGNAAFNASAALTQGKSSKSSSNSDINDVLREKYGLTVKGQTEGSVTYNQPVDSKYLDKAKAQVNPSSVKYYNIPLNDYEALKKGDVSTMKKYENKLGSKAAVEQAGFKPEGIEADPVFIFAFNEQSKRAIQPERAMYKDLKNAFSP